VPESTGLGKYVAEVVTGEAVVIDVPCARFPTRAVALAIDLVVQIVLLFFVSGVALAAAAGGALNPAALAALGLAEFVLIVVGYPATIETLSRGRSLGKLALGLRVVSDDGGPERFRQALMRALLAVLEIWLTLGFLALVTSLLSANGKRLGDIWAGTFVITERMPQPRGPAAALPTLPPALAGWAATLQLSGLDDGTAETAREYLSRYYTLTPAARTEFGQRIAAAVAAQVSPAPPPGTTPPDFLSAVLAERRAREQARIMGRVTQGDSGPAAAPAPGPEQSGPEQLGPDQPGRDQTGPDQTGPDQTGPDQTGPDQTGGPPVRPAGRPGGFLPPR
jgi:uncharacterized RDD family membrane protein YckC